MEDAVNWKASYEQACEDFDAYRREVEAELSAAVGENRFRGALEDIASADETSTLEGAVAIAKHALAAVRS